MKFIHIADVCLGAKPDRNKRWGNDRTQEIQDSFSNIVDLCDTEEIDVLMIAGDLFNEQPTIKQLKYLDLQLSKLRCTRTLIIAGDKDYISEDSAWMEYEFSSDTVVFPPDRPVSLYLKEFDVSVTGYSYGQPVYTDRLLEKIRPSEQGKCHILLGHGGDRQHMPFSKDKLARTGFDYVALGHIHKPSHILKNKMAFAGSLEPLSYRETGKHGYILGEIIEGIPRIRFVPSSIRSYVNMAIELDEQYENIDVCSAVEDTINEIGVQNIYRIKLTGKVSSSLEIDLSAINRRYNINEIIDDTDGGVDIDKLYQSNQNNLLGRFIKILKTDDGKPDKAEEASERIIKDKALAYGVDALIMAGDR